MNELSDYRRANSEADFEEQEAGSIMEEILQLRYACPSTMLDVSPPSGSIRNQRSIL